ncbi:hypothetical protein [Flavicella sediminum]|uniref:hypothetical protein n=1 Tax=Flavicella sediminum TaxID=2585141 RepID=UPI001AA0A988|nr:hypothetical protein [Flavicella sediminum]
MKKILVLVLVMLSTVVSSQEQEPTEKRTNKGRFFLYWGWNRGYYTDSDIRFKGADYDFTLSDVKASDRPTEFTVNNYFHPGNITIPQTDYRIGYFFKENYSISIGVDHMKYVVDYGQEVGINGQIDASYGTDKTNYTGADTEILDADFLEFEHTDGLNYINVELSRFDDVSRFFGMHSKNFSINLSEGVGVGVLYPRTNTTLLGKERHDDFHVSGFGVSARVGLDIAYKGFFIMTEFKTGYINMQDIKTSTSSADSASQTFGYIQPTLVLGGRFYLKKRKK